jgi:hypothetical protein
MGDSVTRPGATAQEPGRKNEATTGDPTPITKRTRWRARHAAKVVHSNSFIGFLLFLSIVIEASQSADATLTGAPAEITKRTSGVSAALRPHRWRRKNEASCRSRVTHPRCFAKRIQAAARVWGFELKADNY